MPSTQTAYEKLVQEETRIAEEAGRLNNELPELTAKENDIQIKLDRAIMEGKNTIRLESMLEEARVDKRRVEHKLKVLNTAHESDIFVGHAKAAIEELGDDLRDLNSDWRDLKTQLDNAFDVYLRVCGKFKALERRDVDLRGKVTYAQSFLPRGSGLTFVEGVPDRTTTNLQNPKGVDGLRGAIWMVAKREGLTRIRDAYEGQTPELKMEQAQREQAAMDAMRNRRVRRAPALVQEPEPQTQENSVHAGQAHLRNVHAPQTQN